jgi:parallel beta-helix repeat protein
VTLVSKDGARSTVLDAGGDTAVGSVVCINGVGANGTVFGKLGKGFTLTGSTGGVIIGGGGLTVSSNDGVRVEGNWATHNGGYGFALLAPTNTTLKSNTASDNGMSGVAAEAAGLVLTGNLARNNSGSGFEISSASAVITKNVAVGNLAPGFSLYSPSTATVSTNTAVANQIGLYVSGHGAVTLSRNNLFGNGDGVLPPSGPNCGLFIQNDDAVNPLTVNASGNFWGTTTGPGANPADLAGGTGCSSDAGGGITLTTAPVKTAKQPLYPPTMK